MSSSNKTANLGLNSWLGSDKPSRTDFNSDNEIIDSYFNNHTTDMEMHLSESDRDRLEEPYYIGTYFGDGKTRRTIDTQCPFDPTFGIIFCINYPMGVNSYETERNYNYAAFVSIRGSNLGVSISGNQINVVHTVQEATLETESATLNTSGLTYFYILFR